MAHPWSACHLASLAQSHPPNGCGQRASWTAGAQDGRASSQWLLWGKWGWGLWTQSLGSARTGVLTPHMRGNAGSPFLPGGLRGPGRGPAQCQQLAHLDLLCDRYCWGGRGLSDLNKATQLGLSFPRTLPMAYCFNLTMAVCCRFFHLILMRAPRVCGFTDEEIELLRPK